MLFLNLSPHIKRQTAQKKCGIKYFYSKEIYFTFGYATVTKVGFPPIFFKNCKGKNPRRDGP